MKTEPNEPAIAIYTPNGLISSKHDMEHLDGMGALMGLSKREYFAAMAMQVLLASKTGFDTPASNESVLSDIAEMSVQAADALITALNK